MKILASTTIILFSLSPSGLLGQTSDTTYQFTLCEKQDKAIEMPVRMDWVREDQKIIEKTLNKLPESGSTLKGIKKLIPHFLDGDCNCVSSTFELGYQVQYSYHKIFGGYGSCIVEAIYSDEQVLKLKMTIDNRNEIITDYLSDFIKLPFECVNNQFTYEKLFDTNLTAYEAENGNLTIRSNDTNVRRNEAINYFADITSGAVFEEPFYVIHWNESEIFGHIHYLIDTKDYDALTSILFSPNPTGRLFAARTLVYMEDHFGYVPDEKTVVRMRETLLGAEPIRSGIISCWANQMNYSYHDVVRDFEKFLAYK